MNTATEVRVTKELAIRENMDPYGNKWNIARLNKIHPGLYTVVKEMEDGRLVVPKNYPPESNLGGQFTKPELARSQITAYLDVAWAKSEEVLERNRKRNERAKEMEKIKAKEEKEKDASETG